MKNFWREYGDLMLVLTIVFSLLLFIAFQIAGCGE